MFMFLRVAHSFPPPSEDNSEARLIELFSSPHGRGELQIELLPLPFFFF